MKLISFFLTLIFTVAAAAAQSDSLRIKGIVLTGNKKTKDQVIFNELRFKSGDLVTQADVDLGISNLSNTNLFVSVKHRLVKSGDEYLLYVDVDERWTTIPILKFSSGGGVAQTTVGVYDPNIFGEFLEAGLQFEQLEDARSGVVWFKNPRLFGGRTGIDLQYWDSKRIRIKYDQEIDDPLEVNGFLMERERFYFGIDHEWTHLFRSAIFYEHNDDTFSDDFVSNKIKQLILLNGLPPDTKVDSVGVGLKYGRVNFKDYLIDGSQLSLTHRLYNSKTFGVNNFSQTDLGFEYFNTFARDNTFAQRLLLGATDTNVLQYWFYLGGLDRIRGYSDNRFAGRYYWLSNTEFRFPVIKRNSYIVQLNTFVDAASVGEEGADLDTLSGLSAGAGFRVILPRFYKFVLRFDFAEPLRKEDDMNFSFGVQQFF